MKLQELIEKLETIKKGAFIHIEYKSEKELAKKYGSPKLEKFTNGCYRLGITYSNLKENKNKVVSETLPWGSMFLKNYIIEHKGRYYLRIYTTHHKSHSQYFLNGVETNKATLEQEYNYKSSSPTLCFNVPIENILKLGRA